MSQRESVRADITIAGSGLAGLTAAANVLSVDPALEIVIIDRGGEPTRPPGDAPGLRVSAITPSSSAFFRRIGIWDALPEAFVEPFTQMRVWDTVTECGDGVAFSSDEFGQPQLGHIVDNAMLRWQLFDFLSGGRGVRFVDAAVSDIRSNAETIEIDTDGGATIVSRLLIGADGRNSAVRDILSMPVKGWSHDQVAVVAHMDAELPHQGCALQRFLPEGPLALLPLPAGRVSLVLSTTPERAQALRDMPDDAFSAAITRDSDNVLGALSVVSDRAGFALVSQFAQDPVANRALLVGDAAHAIHPLAGQGANLGFSDARGVADMVAAAQAAGGDFGDAPYLRRYRRSRKADNLGMLYGLDFLNRVFARERGVVADLRRFGMRWFSSNNTAKKLAAGHAMGVGASAEVQS